MALRGTLTHWKTRMLAQSLGIMPCHALGILEALWHTTAELAPSGNIGRLPNQAIAMEMFYEGDAEQLILALIASRHLEEHAEHRLIVHDWLQHADHNTKRKVDRRGGSMIANDGSPQVMTRHKSIPVPVPVPEPVPEPVPVEKQKTSRVKAASDPRHEPFKRDCEAYARHKSVTFVWDGAEAKQLAALLAAAPALSGEEFRQCLTHRARSDVPHGERPRKWLGDVLRFQEGPLDAFGKPKGSGNGKFAGKTESSLDAASQALAVIAERQASGYYEGSGKAGNPPAGKAGDGRLLGDGGGPVEVRPG